MLESEYGPTTIQGCDNVMPQPRETRPVHHQLPLCCTMRRLTRCSLSPQSFSPSPLAPEGTRTPRHLLPTGSRRNNCSKSTLLCCLTWHFFRGLFYNTLVKFL